MSDQNQLRDELLAVLEPWIMDALKDRTRVAPVEAAVACMGAAAVCIALLPPASRELACDNVTNNLLAHANKRADEIRSGKFDRQQDLVRS